MPLLLLAGCGGRATTDEDRANATNGIAEPASPVAAETPRAPAAAATVARPSPTPSSSPSPISSPSPTPTDASLPEGPFADDSAQGAANVVQRYHALIEAKRYDQAYRLWEPGAVGMTRQAFAASFAKYAEYHAEIGAPGRVDAGAGQRYVTVPVRAYGRLAAGGTFTMQGPFTLHRTADIDGATAEQRQWRIRSSALKPPPAAAGAASNASTARYRCIDGSRLQAAFDPDARTVTLRRDGTRLGVLQQQRTASGIRYARGATEFRGKGDAMTFSEPGKPPIACTAIR